MLSIPYKDHSIQSLSRPFVQARVAYAKNHMPDMDRPTLDKFLELVDKSKPSGSIRVNVLVDTMNLIVQKKSGASTESLIILAKYLGIHFQPPYQRH